VIKNYLRNVYDKIGVSDRLELALFTSDTAARLDLLASVRRCHISNLSPLTYRGALEFKEPIETKLLEPFMESTALSA